MKTLMKFLMVLIGLGLLMAIGYVVVTYYPFIFAKDISGEITGVEKLDVPIAVLARDASAQPPNQVFSFAVAIKNSETGEIVTASSEDRRFAVVNKGQCAIIRFLPYPFWNLEKSGTYFGARLVKLMECPSRGN